MKEYQISIPPEKMHDVLNYATLFYGESATMASESAMLGTPAIYLNESLGYTEELEKKYGLVYNFTESTEDQVQSIEKGVEILQNNNLKEETEIKRKQILREK